MKARHALLLLGLLGLVLGFTLWRGGGERGLRAGNTSQADAASGPVRDGAPLAAPDAAADAGVPEAREALPVVVDALDAASAPEPTSWAFVGRVIDAQTLQPLVGATAHLIDKSLEQEAQGHSDEEGYFTLDVPLREGLAVRVEQAGYAWSVLEVKREHVSQEKAAVVRLSRSATIVARIQRFDGPVAGLEVRVRTDGFWMHQRGSMFWSVSIDDPVWRTEVDSAGVGVVADLPPDAPLTVDVYESGRRIKRLPELQLDAGEERELALRIGAGCRILGQVLETDGTPGKVLALWLTAAEAYASREERHYLESYAEDKVIQRTRPDAEGRFAFDDVAPGEWWIGPAPLDRPDPEGVAPVAVLVTIAPGELQKDVTLEIHRGLTIRGHVEDPDGGQVSSAYVRDRRAQVDHQSRDGSFTLGPLAPGEYELIAQSTGQGGFANSTYVAVRAGDQDVVLSLRHGGSLRVAVFDPDGEPTAADVDLIPENSEAAGYTLMTTSTRADGSYEFEKLLAGTYHVKGADAFGNVGYLRNLEVRPGTQVVEQPLQLAPGARLRVSAPEREGGPRLFLRLRQAGLPVAFQGFDVPFSVAAGSVVVELYEYDSVAEESRVLESRDVAVSAGEQIEVTFDRTKER